jgi:hypothetical protein
MPRKAFELPPAGARNFVRDMKAYFAAGHSPKADAIAAQQAWLLSQHVNKTVKVHEVKELFHAMRDQL